MAHRGKLRVLSGTLTLAGLLWICYLFIETVKDPSLYVPRSWSHLIAATSLITVAISLNAVLFWLFLSQRVKRVISLPLVAKAHYLGQIARYLPGRFWGVVYQVTALRGNIAAPAITRANIDLMLFALCGNAIVAGGVLGMSHSLPGNWSIALMALGVLGACGLLSARLNRLLGQVAVRLPLPEGIQRFFVDIFAHHARPQAVIRIVVVFACSWVLYLLGWQLLQGAFPLFAGVDLPSLCALYSVAWMVGFIAVFTPAGLGVREAAFVLFGQGIAPDGVLAFIAIFARVWLMAAEILLAVIALPLRNTSNAPSTHR